MAERPVFVPDDREGRLAKEVPVQFHWHPGMAPSQKKKNVAALHAAAAEEGLSPLLEVSTKSEERLGQRLSAFNLVVPFSRLNIPFESAYQGSKVFRDGGPYTDLYDGSPQDAKRDPRLRESGPLIGFNFHGVDFPLTPKSVFYDWLYISSLYEHRDFLRSQMPRYAGFTDIEFNPERSINCQARACAIFVSLDRKQLLDACVDSFDAFAELLTTDEAGRERERRSRPVFHTSKPVAVSKSAAQHAASIPRTSESKQADFSHLRPVSIYDAGADQSKIAIALAELLMNWGTVECQIHYLVHALKGDEESKHAGIFSPEAMEETAQSVALASDFKSSLLSAVQSFDKLREERAVLFHSAWQAAPDGFVLTYLSSDQPIRDTKRSLKIDAKYALKLAAETKQFLETLSELTSNLPQRRRVG